MNNQNDKVNINEVSRCRMLGALHGSQETSPDEELDLLLKRCHDREAAVDILLAFMLNDREAEQGIIYRYEAKDGKGAATIQWQPREDVGQQEERMRDPYLRAYVEGLWDGMFYEKTGCGDNSAPSAWRVLGKTSELLKSPASEAEWARMTDIAEAFADDEDEQIGFSDALNRLCKQIEGANKGTGDGVMVYRREGDELVGERQ